MGYKVVKVLEEWYKPLSITTVHYVKCLLINKETEKQCVRVVQFLQRVDYYQMLKTMEIREKDKVKIFKVDEMTKD